MERTALKLKVCAAQQRLESAELRLGEALSTLERLPRAQKTLVSEVLRQAFDGLKDARRDLTELESLLEIADGA
jgi:hypothetical protein